MGKTSNDSLNQKTMLKRHCSELGLIHHDNKKLVEFILERLPVKSLMRFKCVAKKWKATIESQAFHKLHLNHRMLSRGVDVLFVVEDAEYEEVQRSINLHGSIISTVKYPFPSSSYRICSMVCYNSCDGLLCLHNFSSDSCVVNPATRWFRSFPFSDFQQFLFIGKGEYDFSFPRLGFGKDKSRGVYKPVWLYNSTDSKAKDVTTCEVFDFITNAWRTVVPASPSRILPYQKPVYLGDYLYWLTEKMEVLSFNLQTETFCVLSKAPFDHVVNPRHVILCVLNDQLCVSEKIWPTQEIWSFDSSMDSNTWNRICSIDLTKTISWFGDPYFALNPVAILEKSKLVLHGSEYLHPLVVYDLETETCEVLFTPSTAGSCVCYFESLFSTI